MPVFTPLSEKHAGIVGVLCFSMERHVDVAELLFTKRYLGVVGIILCLSMRGMLVWSCLLVRGIVFWSGCVAQCAAF